MRRVPALTLITITSLLFTAIWFGSTSTANSARKTSDAARDYGNSCASCHGSDGRAKTFKAKFNGAKDLTKPEWQESVSDSHIFNVISNGRKKMPAFGTKFSQARIEALVKFVRGLRK
jgi:mono/diheme cytochrome c family protein